MSRAHTAYRRVPAIVFILVAFVLLAGVYSIATPIFEAGDEIWHYPFVQHLATGHSLPVQDPSVETLWEQEGGQPPLYYALGAAATFWIDTSDLADRRWLNPEAKLGIPLIYGNKNLIVHTTAEDFPWHNTALAVHLLRLLSILLSLGTVALTYALALEIKPGDKKLAAIASALVAFNPMFLFISASVNNDNLAVLFATLALLLILRLSTRGVTFRRMAVLGLVLGLAALSKVSDLGLILIAGVVFLYLLWREWNVNKRSPIQANPNGGSAFLHVLVACVLCAVIVVAVGAWWYVRNWLTYGDPLAFDIWVAISGGRPVPATWATLLGEFEGFRISYWGNFGGVNIIAPGWVYTVLDGLTVLAALGLMIGLVRRTLPRLAAVPSLWLVLICISLVRWTLLTLASQGRLIFPAISAVAILMACGLAQFSFPRFNLKIQGILPKRRDLFLPLALAVFLGAFALIAPFGLIAPTYAMPLRVRDENIVQNATHITFDGQAELVGYAVDRSVRPGEELSLVLYWRALTRINEDWSVNVTLFDAQGNVMARWNAFPGRGLYPTRLWQPGEILVDPYRIPVAPKAQGPGVGRVEVGLFRRVPLENLTARDPQGRTITPAIARFKIAAPSGEQVENPVQYQFGDKITLAGYRIENGGDQVHVRLYWRARAAVNEDYTVFVHLLDANGQILAQKDNPPQQGAFPTLFWDAGDTIADDYTLRVPGGSNSYAVEVGMYSSRDSTRLGIQGGGDSLILGNNR